MKYLRLVYSDEHLLHSLPESPADSECGAYAATLLGDGRLIAGEALHPVETASTVRVRRASEASRSDRCGNSISEPRHRWAILDLRRSATAAILTGVMSVARKT